MLDNSMGSGYNNGRELTVPRSSSITGWRNQNHRVLRIHGGSLLLTFPVCIEQGNQQANDRENEIQNLKNTHRHHLPSFVPTGERKQRESRAFLSAMPPETGDMAIIAFHLVSRQATEASISA